MYKAACIGALIGHVDSAIIQFISPKTLYFDAIFNSESRVRALMPKTISEKR